MATDQEFLHKILEEIQQVRRLLEEKGTGTPAVSFDPYDATEQRNDLVTQYPFEEAMAILQTRGAEVWSAWNSERNRYSRLLQRERERKLKEEKKPSSPPSPLPEWMSVQIPAKRKKELRELAQMTPEQYKAWKREQELVEREKKKIYKSTLEKRKPKGGGTA